MLLSNVRVPRWVTPDPSQVEAATPAASASMSASVSVTASEAAAGAASGPSVTLRNSSLHNNSHTEIIAQYSSKAFLPCRTHTSMERQLGGPEGPASSKAPNTWSTKAWFDGHHVHPQQTSSAPGAHPEASITPQLLPQVSWVRRRDWHILTSGTLTYTKEKRFAVHHPEGSTEWTLAITYVQLTDAGTYECQISTGGGIVSHLVHLKVVVPRAVIPGNGEYHVETGSTISLVCFIEQSPEAPPYIFWYHNDRMINYDTERGGVTVSIEKLPQVKSELSVTNANIADSGNYTCEAANTEPASITVYITAAKKSAAVQPRAVDTGTVHKPERMHIIVSSVLLLLFGLRPWA